METPKENQKLTLSYIIGFIASLVLTLVAYFLVAGHRFEGGVLLSAILGLAIIQLLVQLICFLHIGHETGPRWNLAALISTLSVIGIVVVGSLWIMAHLNYNMTPTEVDSYVMHQEGMQK